MKLLQDLINEATKVKDKVDIGVDIGIDLENKLKGDLTTQQKPKQKAASRVSRKAATADQTRAKMANVTVDDEKLAQLDQMQLNTNELDMDDEISDEEAARNAGFDLLNTLGDGDPEPRNPENLPAIISKAMVKQGTDLDVVEPEWHMVKHLPGYLAAPIRALGRKVFAPFTNTAIEDIQVLADLGGGPNTEAEIDAVSRFVSSRGTRDSAAELQFEKVLPGYQADVVFYNAEGYTFMLVKDFMGNYIYSWPQKDSKSLEISSAEKRLGHQRKLPRLN